MKRGLIIILGTVFLVLSIIGTTALANQNKVDNQHKLKLIYDDKYILEELINEDSNVIIKYNEQTIHDFNISEDENITLDRLILPYNKLISYWQMEANEDQHIITPVIIDKSEVSINFTTTNGGGINENTLLPSMTKTTEKGTKLSEILPDIKPEKDFYFAGWFTIVDVENEIEIKKEDREDLKEIKSDIKKKEKELSKEDDKGKEKELKSEIKNFKKELEEAKEDDKFETEIVKKYQEVKDIDSIELNSDEEFIAVLYPDINDNNRDDRKEEINLLIDFGLDNEVYEETIHVGQPIKLSKLYNEDHIFIDWFLDSEFNEKLGDETRFTKDTSLFAQWKTAEEIVSEGGVRLIDEERISNKIEKFINEKNQDIYEHEKGKSEEKEEDLNKKYDEELVQHTEKHYTLKNFKVNQIFLIKFYNDENFMFSVALPYGRTIEILNENDHKVIEYGVRQESSINIKDLINDSENINFDIKTIKKNNAVITQIYPKNNNKEID